jgi:hypothetical protein
LRIENYFQQVQETIQSCSVVQLSDISYNKRGSHEGYIRGELYFVMAVKIMLCLRWHRIYSLSSKKLNRW